MRQLILSSRKVKVFAGLAIILLAAPAWAAPLTFDGATRSEQRNVRSAWEALPAAWREGAPPVVVRFQDAPVVVDGERYRGGYHAGESLIVLSRWTPRALSDFPISRIGQLERRRTALHEAAHHLWFKRLTAGQRSEWRAFWRDNPRLMPTSHARSNPEEGFAESVERLFGRRMYLLGSFLGHPPLDGRVVERLEATFR